MGDMKELFGEVIHSYSRAEAIGDGTLMDCTSMARQAGIKFSVALTSAVYEKYVKVPDGVECQDEAGRLWDVIYMFTVAAKKAAGAQINYQLYVRNDNRKPKLVNLKAICGPGDNAEPVITILLPEED